MTKKQIQLIQDLILFTEPKEIVTEREQLIKYLGKQLKEEIAKSNNRRMNRKK